MTVYKMSSSIYSYPEPKLKPGDMLIYLGGPYIVLKQGKQQSLISVLSPEMVILNFTLTNFYKYEKL